MDFQQLPIPRQRFLFGAGFGLIATVAAACTTYGKQQAAPDDQGAASSTSRAASGAPGPAKAIAKTSDVPVGSGVIVDEIVVTQPSAGVFKGFSAICTHRGCTVAEVANGTINCPCHGSKYNLDGSVANGPAPRPLAAKNISVVGDSIVLA